MASPDIAWLKALYDGYIKGEIEPIFGRLAEDVEWMSALDTPAAEPFAGTFHGAEGVRRFFHAVAQDWQVTRYEPLRMIANGDLVLVSIAVGALNRRTGKTAELTTQHAMILRDGKIQRFVECSNDAAPLEAACH
ncbi:nuclear transport factor 2 family protein [Azospirillum doebereinerae]